MAFFGLKKTPGRLTLVAAGAMFALTTATFDAAARSAGAAQGATTNQGAATKPSKAPTMNPTPRGTSSKIIQSTEPEKNPSCSKGFVWCPSSKGRGVCMFRKCGG